MLWTSSFSAGGPSITSPFSFSPALTYLNLSMALSELVCLSAVSYIYFCTAFSGFGCLCVISYIYFCMTLTGIGCLSVVSYTILSCYEKYQKSR